MEYWKLIELLNEAQNSWDWLFWHWVGNFERKYYAKNHWRLTIDTLGYTDEDYETYDYSDRDICGKDGGFIKWLVDNDKIDFKKNKLQVLKDIDVRWEVIYDCTLFDKVDWVIMLLSISDTPIDDLISYLK